MQKRLAVPFVIGYNLDKTWIYGEIGYGTSKQRSRIYRKNL